MTDSHTSTEMPAALTHGVSAAAQASTEAQLARLASQNRRQRNVMIAVVLLALVITAWQWGDARNRVVGLEQQISSRLRVDDEEAGKMRARQAEDADRIAELSTRLASQQTLLEETRARLDGFEEQYQDLASTRDERLLAEVEHALTLAQQQLQLAGNTQIALVALTSAETRLARADTGRYVVLRRALAADVDRLRQLPAGDVTGQALRLDALLSAIDTLPLAFEHAPRSTPAKREPAAASWPGAAIVAEIWQELRALVRIERLDQPAPALLAPEQAFFLRENLKLRLLNARIALLQRNGKVWHEDMVRAQSWLETYFDRSSHLTDNALAAVRELGRLDPGATMPGLDEAFAALGQLKSVRERPAPARSR